jgi:hypothetical protein
MSRSWLLPGLLLTAFALISFAQQAAAPELTDHERIVQLEKRAKDVERVLAGVAADGTIELTPTALEMRLRRIEARLDRLEQQAIRSSGPPGASSDRMIDGRLRSLENAVMRLQQQR